MFRYDQTIIQWTEINTKGYKLHSYYHNNKSFSQYIYIYMYVYVIYINIV
jgi:hypothetical protein